MKINRTTTFALAATAALAFAVPASAATPPKQTLDITMSPAKAGTKKKPQNVTVQIHGHTDPQVKDDGSTYQPIMSAVTVSFAKGIVINDAGFKTCDFAKAEAEGAKACPSAAKIGSGTASAAVGSQKVQAQLGLYKGGKETVIFTIDVPDFTITTATSAKFQSASDAKFGKKINLAIPEKVRQPVAGVNAVVDDLKLTINGKAKVKQGKKSVSVSYAQTVGCPANKKWEFLGEFTSDLGPLNATDEVACK